MAPLFSRFASTALCLLLLSASALGQSRQSLSSFLDLAWGSSRAFAKRSLATQGIFRLMSEDEVYAYFSGPYEGRDAFLALGFLHDRLFAGTVSYPGDPARVVQDYRRAVALLSSIYGRPSAVIENFVPPFASGDGNEASALRENKAAMQTIWKFDDGNDITAFVDRSTMGPTIIFKNTVLMGQYLEGLGRR